MVKIGTKVHLISVYKPLTCVDFVLNKPESEFYVKRAGGGEQHAQTHDVSDKSRRKKGESSNQDEKAFQKFLGGSTTLIHGQVYLLDDFKSLAAGEISTDDSSNHYDGDGIQSADQPTYFY